MNQDLIKIENSVRQKGFNIIAGVDEAGRGPLAGPVVSAAVILPQGYYDVDINDSKKLSPSKRNRIYDRIYNHAISVGIGIIDAHEIDRINVLKAAQLSMSIAASNLCPQPDCLLIDGPFTIQYDIPQFPIKKGDSLSLSIAAASIVAKVTRDRLMEQYHFYYPEFGFAQHKGYPTKIHKSLIQKYGCCPIHRLSFKGTLTK